MIAWCYISEDKSSQMVVKVNKHTITTIVDYLENNFKDYSWSCSIKNHGSLLTVTADSLASLLDLVTEKTVTIHINGAKLKNDNMCSIGLSFYNNSLYFFHYMIYDDYENDKIRKLEMLLNENIKVYWSRYAFLSIIPMIGFLGLSLGIMGLITAPLYAILLLFILTFFLFAYIEGPDFSRYRFHPFLSMDFRDKS